MHWKDDWTGFFILYFKWGYYLCVTPFRLEWNKKQQMFTIQRNFFQSFLCGLQYIVLGIWYVIDTKKIPVNSLYKNPVVYFTLAFNLNAAYHQFLLLVVSFWRRQERFLALVNFNSQGYAKSTRKVKCLAYSFCFLFTILPFFYVVKGYQILPSNGPWDPEMYLRCLIVKGRDGFYAENLEKKGISYAGDETCQGNVPELWEISGIDGFLGLIALLMEISRQIIGFYADFFPLICCFSLWYCTGSIRELLKEWKDEEEQEECQIIKGITGSYVENGEDVENQNKLVLNGKKTKFLVGEDKVKSNMEKVEENGKADESKEYLLRKRGHLLLKRYELCKSFSNGVNKALGQLLFAYVFSSIMYLSTCMDAVLVLEDWCGKLRVAFFFTAFIIMFFVGSEIVNQVYAVREWLSKPENNKFLEERRLLVLIHEITCYSIGVSGNGMFTVTYSTFKTVMTTTVTFFIIILQFQKPRGQETDFKEVMALFNKTIMEMNNTQFKLDDVI